ncbi:MAG: hypothetical protein R3C15_10175 [Thermoleophilia bacterium]
MAGAIRPSDQLRLRRLAPDGSGPEGPLRIVDPPLGAERGAWTIAGAPGGVRVVYARPGTTERPGAVWLSTID